MGDQARKDRTKAPKTTEPGKNRSGHGKSGPPPNHRGRRLARNFSSFRP
jgi:hypothetical protein